MTQTFVLRGRPLMTGERGVIYFVTKGLSKKSVTVGGGVVKNCPKCIKDRSKS